MVWFQCEDCGENLKKPKLPNHFRICSAHKLSCIDCGAIFSKESVQTHTQCMTEAEKYGPKDHVKPSQNSNSKPEKPKKNADVDITVGLSSRPPWFCSLCNTPTTSKQTLLLHADGKKHRAKAKASLAAQKHYNQTEETEVNNKNNSVSNPYSGPVQKNGSEADEPKPNDTSVVNLEKMFGEKRKHDEVDSVIVTSTACDVNNGEVIQAEEKEKKNPSKKTKFAAKPPNSECTGNHADDGVALKKKIKWKKLVISALKSKPDGAMKIKKVQKLVMKELKASGIAGEELQLCDTMMEKINSSSRFVIDNKHIFLADKANKS
ncbi:UBP1-associated proteins 1C isoform X2 [Phalaenopsis equestris]|uniref:UBP1-associated proteins 1C isoform X2 n=1 Tax=Phalaenopsis equestris TaxID=78828 RepID=UPI0009E2D28F|nr:UBP1-associated proteins 1C isoform X2 [Phalaenopsis equestris]